jgi:hypothetical protein
MESIVAIANDNMSELAGHGGHVGKRHILLKPLRFLGSIYGPRHVLMDTLETNV